MAEIVKLGGSAPPEGKPGPASHAEPEATSNRGLLIGVGALLVVLVGVVGFLVLNRGGAESVSAAPRVGGGPPLPSAASPAVAGRTRGAPTVGDPAPLGPAMTPTAAGGFAPPPMAPAVSGSYGGQPAASAAVRSHPGGPVEPADK